MTFEQIIKSLKKRASSKRDLKAFGASTHLYKSNEVLSVEELTVFELNRRVTLPEEYRSFVLSVGNGGAGPYYGLFPLGYFDGSGGPLVQWSPGDSFAGNLSVDFPHSDSWNLAQEELQPPEFESEDEEDEWHEQQEEKMWAANLVDGAFPICHQGCAYRNLLIVTGPERGNIWLDARTSGGGIMPVSTETSDRVTFLEWYISWLNNPHDFK